MRLFLSLLLLCACACAPKPSTTIGEYQADVQCRWRGITLDATLGNPEITDAPLDEEAILSLFRDLQGQFGCSQVGDEQITCTIGNFRKEHLERDTL